MAERIAWLAPAELLSGTLVPVPTSPMRSLLRGFDPALELGYAFSRLTGVPLARALIRRGIGRQVGRRRVERLGDPPPLRAAGRAPRSALLIDDVITTGATMAASAAALRRAGAVRVVALSFSRRL
jgi:predicted amidophosphoribosyltransferase